jgi:hypothetical protein
MRAWTELKERVDGLRLTRAQRKIALHLIEGLHTRDIAAAVGTSEAQVKLCAGYLLYLLRKQPPDASLPVNAALPPDRGPAGAGIALRLPQ